MNQDPDYQRVDAFKDVKMHYALAHCTQGEDGRFDGTPVEQAALVTQMVTLFDDPPAEGQVFYLRYRDTIDLANDLAQQKHRWSPGQFSTLLRSMRDPSRLPTDLKT